MRQRDIFDAGLVLVWISTVLTWILTLIAAFAVSGIEALSTVVIAIIYSILNRFKGQRKIVRVVMWILLAFAGLSIVLLVYEIVSAINANPRP